MTDVKVQFRHFIRAIRCEFEQESIYHTLYELKGNIRYVPRSYTIYKILRKFKLINALMPVMFVLWSLFFQVIYTSFLFFKWIFKVIFTKKQSLPDNLYLSLSDIKYFSFIESSEKFYPSAIMEFPFKKANTSFTCDLPYINLLSVTTFGDFLSAYVKAISFCWYLMCNRDVKFMLYSYSAFYWFWAYNALAKKRPTRIWISNHFDRWTVLATSLGSKISVVQHGQLEYYDYNTGKSLFPTFSNKLYNITQIFVHDKVSTDYFKQYIIDDDLEILSVKARMTIVEWRKEGFGKIKVLVVGHHNGLSFQKKFIKTLLNSNDDLDLSYKYHPQQLTEIKESRIWEIKEGGLIPRADIVISYGSSLDKEIVTLMDCVIFRYDSKDIFNKDPLLYITFISKLHALIDSCR